MRKKESNKKNLLKLLIFSFIFFIILAPEIYANNGDETPEPGVQIKPEDTHTYQKDDGEISFDM